MREKVRELNGPGSRTVWVPIEGGLQLFSYWDRDNLLVISVKGAAVERALPWAQSLAGETVRPNERLALEGELDGDPEPELPAWIAEHLRKYQATNGADGHIWNGVPTLLLTTTGRKSGKEGTLPLIYGKSGARFVIVASRGRAGPPGLVQEPGRASRGEAAGAADKFPARASTAKGPERAKLWSLMTKIWPAYDDYQSKTTREIPVVVLERG